MTTFALLPAAGHSRRMGRPKLSLPLGERTVLQWTVAALRDAGIDTVLVVLGPHVAELQALAENAGARVLLLDAPTPDMRATIKHGLRWLADHCHPLDTDRWLLIPADHPTLDATLVRELLAVADAHPASSIVIPTYQGRRGHPALIAWKHVAGMSALPENQGLNVYLRQHQAETLLWPVASAAVLLDLDTPEDYERLRHHWERLG
ncbi:MAG: NTP transferase domain-containing protein [Gemmataceae bacterium]